MFPRFRGAGARFVHPLDPPPRTAILAGGFRPSRWSRVFPSGWNEEAEKLAPGAIAGPFYQLFVLTRSKISLTHAVISLAWDPQEFLTADQRELLWSSFGVPVFEQYLGPGNVLLASECEAHAGLHVTEQYRGPTSRRSGCLCGSSVPILPHAWSSLGSAEPKMRKPAARSSVARPLSLTG